MDSPVLALIPLTLSDLGGGPEVDEPALPIPPRTGLIIRRECYGVITFLFDPTIQGIHVTTKHQPQKEAGRHGFWYYTVLR